MTFVANVVRVLIASPGDLADERDRIERAIHRWNSDHADATKTILLPVRWETDATPEVGGRPQAIINRQLVDNSDVVIGMFWTRLGTPTGESDSGTAEEIERAVSQGKHVSIYFSNKPAEPSILDTGQLNALLAFRQRVESEGLTQTFSTPDELERNAASMLVRVVRERFGVAPAESALPVAAAPRAALSLQLLRTGSSDYRMVVTNVGAGEAQDVVIAWDGGPGPQGWDLIEADEPVDFLPPGGRFDYIVAVDMGSPMRANYRVSWRNEDGSSGASRATLSL